MRSIRTYFSYATVIVLLLSYNASVHSRELLAESGAYVDTYGLVKDADSPFYARTISIFNNLKRVSGVRAQSAQLLIIKSPQKPWAIALADGNIVLSKGALEVIYSVEDLETADAWMAFVLGHELAHLINRDMWHHQMHAALSGNNVDQSMIKLRAELSKSSLNAEAIKDRELKADEQGFIYAALGGYKTNRILSAKGAADGFLELWVEQTRTRIDDTHHSARLRTQFLKERLTALDRSVVLFNFGLKLAHFGRYEDATYLVERFHRQYPSRQALNNLAYIKIQLARKAMPASMAYRFWIPTLLEDDAGLRLDRGLSSELPNSARQLLKEAVSLLSKAVELDAEDIVARINLIAAHFYLGEYFHARAVVEDALSLRPDSLQLQGLRALIILEQEPDIDMWPRVSKLLQDIADLPNGPENVVFNFARLLLERNRHGKAKSYLQGLLDKRMNVPNVYREIVCRQSANSQSCVNEYAVANLKAAPHSLPVPIGASIDEKSTRKILSSWVHQNQILGPIAFDTFSNAAGDYILAIDYRVELVSLASNVNRSTFELTVDYGDPDVILPLSNSTLWSYGPVWSAVVRDNQVREVWVAR